MILIQMFTSTSIFNIYLVKFSCKSISTMELLKATRNIFAIPQSTLFYNSNVNFNHCQDIHVNDNFNSISTSTLSIIQHLFKSTSTVITNPQSTLFYNSNVNFNQSRYQGKWQLQFHYNLQLQLYQ